MATDSPKKTDAAPVGTTGMTRMPLTIATEVAPAEPSAAVPEEEETRPTAATAAIGLMVAAGGVDVALGVYWLVRGGNALGGLLFLFIGAAYLYGGRGLHAGESWGWGAGVLAGAFAILLGALLLPLGALPIALAVVVIVPLVLAREYYGMVRYDEEAEARKKEELRTQRTHNQEGLRCPKCGSTQLWVAQDGSAFCESCKAGTISMRPAP